MAPFLYTKAESKVLRKPILDEQEGVCSGRTGKEKWGRGRGRDLLPLTKTAIQGLTSLQCLHMAAI